MQNAVSGTMSLCAVIWWNKETKSNKENTRPEPKESRTWSMRGIGSWLSLLLLVELLVVHRDPHTARFYKEYFKDVSREFDEFRVNAHICKLRCWYL